MQTLYVRIADQKLVEISSHAPTPDFLDAIATNYGGVAADYAYYTMTAAEEVRVANGDEYTLIWVDKTIKGMDFSIEEKKDWLNVIISTTSNKVTFNSINIAKVQVYDPKQSYIQNDIVFSKDAIWKCQIASTDKEPATESTDWSQEAQAILATLSILIPDKSTIDKTANFTDNLPVRLPNGSASMEVTFTDGVCKKIILFNSFTNCGTWYIPADNIRVTLNGTNYRIDKQATFSGLLPF